MSLPSPREQEGMIPSTPEGLGPGPEPESEEPYEAFTPMSEEEWGPPTPVSPPTTPGLPGSSDEPMEPAPPLPQPPPPGFDPFGVQRPLNPDFEPEPEPDADDAGFGRRISAHKFSARTEDEDQGLLKKEALYHFMFEKHGNPEIGNDALDALSVIRVLIEEFSKFRGMDTEFVSGALKTAQKLVDHAPKPPYVDASDLSRSMPAAIVPLVARDHQICVVIRATSNGIGAEVVLVNTGSGVELQGNNVYQAWAATARERGGLLDAGYVAAVANSLAKAAEDVCQADEGGLYAAITKKLGEAGFSVTADGKSAVSWIPRVYPQMSGGCSFWSTWNGLLYLISNAPVFGERRALDAAHAYRVNTFCSCFVARCIARGAFASAEGRCSRANAALRLVLSGSYAGRGIPLIFGDGDEEEATSVHAYVSSRMRDGASRTALLSPFFDTLALLGKPIGVKWTPGAPSELPLPPNLGFYLPPEAPFRAAFDAAVEHLGALFAALEHNRSGDSIASFARFRAAAADAASRRLAAERAAGVAGIRAEPELDLGVLASELSPRAKWARGSSVTGLKWSGVGVVYDELTSKLGVSLVGGKEALKCLLYCVVSDHRKWIVDRKLEGSGLAERYLNSVRAVLEPPSQEIGYQTIYHVSGDRLFELSKITAYLREAVVDFLPVFLIKERETRPIVFGKRVGEDEGTYWNVVDAITVLCMCLSGEKIPTAPLIDEKTHDIIRHVIKYARSEFQSETDSHWREPSLSHLSVIDSLGSADRVASAHRACLAEVPISPLASFVATVTEANRYVNESNETTGDTRRSLGDRDIRDRRLVYSAAGSMKSLERIDMLDTRDGLNLLISAYAARPSCLATLGHLQLLNKDESDKKLWKDPLSENQKSVIRHLRAVVKLIGGGDANDRALIRDFHTTAMRLMRVRLDSIDFFSGDDRSGPTLLATVGAYYDLLATRSSRADMETLHEFASNADAAGATPSWIRAALESVMNRSEVHVLPWEKDIVVEGNRFASVLSRSKTSSEDISEYVLRTPVSNGDILVVADAEVAKGEERKIWAYASPSVKFRAQFLPLRLRQCARCSKNLGGKLGVVGRPSKCDAEPSCQTWYCSKECMILDKYYHKSDCPTKPTMLFSDPVVKGAKGEALPGGCQTDPSTGIVGEDDADIVTAAKRLFVVGAYFAGRWSTGDAAPIFWKFKNTNGELKWSVMAVLCDQDICCLFVEKADADDWYVYLYQRGETIFSGGRLVLDGVKEPEVLVYARWIRDVASSILVEKDGSYFVCTIANVSAVPEGVKERKRYFTNKSMWQLRYDILQDVKGGGGDAASSSSAANRLRLMIYRVHPTGLTIERLDWPLYLVQLSIAIETNTLEMMASLNFSGIGPNDGFARRSQWERARGRSSFERRALATLGKPVVTAFSEAADVGSEIDEWMKYVGAPLSGEAAGSKKARRPEERPEYAERRCPPKRDRPDRFREQYRGCCEMTARDVDAAWTSRIEGVVSAMASLKRKLAPTVLELLVGASPISAWDAQERNPWPECVAECLAMSPDVVLWCYACVFEKIFRETRGRLSAITKDPSSRVSCSALLYAFELVNAADVTYDYERTLPDALAEISTGFLMRRQQREMLAEIESAGGGDLARQSTARQLAMGAGKTTFIVPRLVFDRLLFGPRDGHGMTSAVIIVPVDLVSQSVTILRKACAFLGFVDLSVVDRKPMVTKHGLTMDLQQFLSPYVGATFVGTLQASANVADAAMYPLGAVSLISDKELQRMFLEVASEGVDARAALKVEKKRKKLQAKLAGCQPSPGANDFDIVDNKLAAISLTFEVASDELLGSAPPRALIFRRLRSSLVICDEVDSVVDPMKCEMNVPVDLDSPALPSLEPVAAKIVADRDFGPYSLSTTLLEKIGEASREAAAMKVCGQFGLGTDSADFERSNAMTGIPYRFSQTPMDGSEYTDLELRMTLTLEAYLHQIRNLSHMRSADAAEILSLLSVETAEWTVFDGDVKSVVRTAFPYLDESCWDVIVRLVNGAPSEQCAKDLSSRLATLDPGRRERFARVYAYNMILRYVLPHTRQTNVGMLEFLSPTVCGERVMFSGTVHVHTPSEETKHAVTELLGERRTARDWASVLTHTKDDFTNPLIDAVICGFTCKSSVATGVPAAKTRRRMTKEARVESHVVSVTEPEVLHLDPKARRDQDELEESAMTLFAAPKAVRKYNALIDVAGVLRLHAAEHYARRISELGGCDVLYVNALGVRSLYSAATGRTVGPHTSLEDVDDGVILYDQKSTVGVDFGQLAAMRGLVVVDRGSTWTAVAQGSFRLRRLARGHSVDFLVVGDGEAYDIFRDPTRRRAHLRDTEKSDAATAEPLAQLAIAAAAIRTESEDAPLSAFSRRVWVDSVDSARLATREDRDAAKERVADENFRMLSGHLHASDAFHRFYLDASALAYERRLRAKDIHLSVAASKGKEKGKQREAAEAEQKSAESEMQKQSQLSELPKLERNATFSECFRTDTVDSKFPKSSAYAKMLKSLQTEFGGTPVYFALDAAFNFYRRWHGIVPSMKRDDAPVPCFATTRQVFAVRTRGGAAAGEDVVHVCSHVDATALMHYAEVTGVGATLYSSRGVAVAAVNGGAGSDDLDLADVVRVVAFWRRARGDATEIVARLVERFGMPPHLVRLYRALADGLGKVNAGLERLGREPFGGEAAGASVGHPAAAFEPHPPLGRCFTCGAEARFICSVCKRATFCSKDCLARSDHRHRRGVPGR